MIYTRTAIRRLNAWLRAGLMLLGPKTAGVSARLPVVGPASRILFVKLVGLGDGVLARSIIEHLRSRHPGLGVGLLVGPSTAEVMGASSASTVHHYDPLGADQGIVPAVRAIRAIRRHRYDLVIDFEQHYVLVALLLWLTRIPCRIGLAASTNPRGRFQTHTVPLSGDDLMWDAYQALARVVDPSLGPVSTVPPGRDADVVADVDRWWSAHGLDRSDAVVTLHVGCGSTAVARRWPVTRFVWLAERLASGDDAVAFLLTGSPSEQPLVAQFLQLFSGRAVDATGLGSVAHTAEAVRRCQLAVSNDTGVMHLAAAMGTPTVGLFGPNHPSRYAPVGSHVASVYTTDIECSPCIQIHEGVVPECFAQELGRCLLDIDVDSVMAAVDAVTGRAKAAGLATPDRAGG